MNCLLDVSSFQSDSIAEHIATVVPLATGGGDCGETDRGSSNNDDSGAVADAGRYDEC